MAVEDIRELFSDRSSGRDAKGRRSVRVFLVLCDDVADGPEAAEIADTLPAGMAIPSIGDAHPGDADKFVRSVEAKPEAGEPCEFRVTVQYSTPVASGPGEEDPEENPLARPMTIGWGSTKTSVPVERATFIDGELEWPDIPVESSAYEVFDPPIMRDFGRRVLTITHNEATFDSALAIVYTDAVNEEAFVGCAPGTVKIASITASRHYENEVWYWAVEYQFDVNPDGWNLFIVDRGTRVLDAAGEKSVTAKDGDGNPYNSPIHLDGNGWKLGIDDPVVYLEYRIYPIKDFAALGLEE